MSFEGESFWGIKGQSILFWVVKNRWKKSKWNFVCGILEYCDGFERNFEEDKRLCMNGEFRGCRFGKLNGRVVREIVWYNHMHFVLYTKKSHENVNTAWMHLCFGILTEVQSSNL